MGPKALAASRLCNLDSEAMTSLPPPPPTPPPPTPPSPQPPQAPRPRNARATRKAPHGVPEGDWPFFGEMCRALALKIFRDYDPDVVIGIPRAGVIPGAAGAGILPRAFASLATPGP